MRLIHLADADNRDSNVQFVGVGAPPPPSRSAISMAEITAGVLAPPASTTRETRTEETTNFDISKKVVSHQRESGVVKRLTVAVLVDGVLQIARGHELRIPHCSGPGARHGCRIDIAVGDYRQGIVELPAEERCAARLPGERGECLKNRGAARHATIARLEAPDGE